MTIKARFINPEHTAISVELEEDDVLGNFYGPTEDSPGLIQFSLAWPSAGNKEYDALASMIEAGQVAISAYEAPETPPPDTISDRQFFQQLAVNGEITETEALAAVQTGAIPKRLDDAIKTLPADKQFSARMLVTGATQFSLSNPMAGLLATALGRSTAQMKDIWAAASLL